MIVKVLLADDQPLVRAGFALFINTAPDLRVVAEAATGRDAVELTRRHLPDVVVMDIRMPDLDGIAATRLITADPDLADVRVLILTTFDLDDYVLQALKAGASGFLGKSADVEELLDAVRTVHRGDALLSVAATKALISRYLSLPDPAVLPAAGTGGGLTERETEIVALVAQGLSNDDIAARLVVSPHTVKTHVNRAMAKLGAHDRAQLVIYAYENRLVRPGR